MVQSRVSGDSSRSPSSSGIYFQGDGTSQALASSPLSSSVCNYSSNSVAGTGCANLGSFSGDMNNAAFNCVANSGPSVAASSLVTDETSALSNGPHLQRSASINTESYMHLPASPISFTSNNMSISGSSIMDGPSVARQNSHQEQTAHSARQNQLQQPGASSSLSLPALENGQLLLPSGSRVMGSYIEDPNNLPQLTKKPRLDIKQEDMIQQQVPQHLLQRQDSMQLQGLTPQFKALFMQQQRMRQQQQILQSIPSMQSVPMKQQQQHPLQWSQHLQQQQHPLQWSQHLQQQGLLQVNPMKPPSDGGICARRLMQYLYHQRQRPADNGITYWRKFVAEYYSPHAKKRWCLSLYNNVGQHALGVFPQAAMDAWQCKICGAKSGRGFEASSEVLPRLSQIKFGSGVVDELLFLDWPREYRYPSGVMVLEYAKAVQESVYEQLRVVREGKLRIVFTQDLKILSWEFCVRRHEELLPRRLVAPKVNQLVQVAQKCHSTIKEGGEGGVSQQDLQTNSNMVLTAGRQLAKSLDLQSLNELGFSKRYVRCLQISEVVNTMKDLVDFCWENKMGPVEGLKSYNRHMVAAKLPSQKMEEIEQAANSQGLLTDRNTLEKSLALHPGLNNQVSSDQPVGNRGALSGSAQAALALTNIQGMIMCQNSLNSSHNSLQQDASLFNSATPSMAMPVQGAVTSAPGSLQRLPSTNNSAAPVSRKPGAGKAQHLQRRHHLGSNGSVAPQGTPQRSQGDNSQTQQDQMVQQFLQEMSSGSGGMQGQPLVARNRAGIGSNAAPAQAAPRVVAGRSKSFRDAANGGPDVSNGRAPEVSGGNGIEDDVMGDIGQEFLDDSFFDGDLDERTLGFLWKN